MSQNNLPTVDWMEIISSAPGKFIISGEYSVQYDKQAIAAAIDLRTRVTIRPNTSGLVRLNLRDVNTICEWPTSELKSYRLVSKYSECLDYNGLMPVKLNRLLQKMFHCTTKATNNGEELSPGLSEKDMAKKADDAVMAFLLLYISLGDSYCGSARPPIEVKVESAIPVGAGLGSSSAYSVALCGALMRVYRVAAEKHIISNWAFNIDKFFHGRPSGVDNNVVTVGGYILFQQGKIKTIGAAHTAPIKVMLIDTCVSRSTKALCETVAALQRDDPAMVNVIFNSINDVTSQIWRKLNDLQFSPRIIAANLKINQQYLDDLGVGHARLRAICAKAEELNLTAKQTGAGGGGTAFVLYDDSDNCTNLKLLRDWLLSENYRVHDHKIDCEGLVVKLIRSSGSNLEDS